MGPRCGQQPLVRSPKHHPVSALVVQKGPSSTSPRSGLQVQTTAYIPVSYSGNPLSLLGTAFLSGDMMFQPALLLPFLSLIPLIATAEPARLHEARQGPLSSTTVETLTPGPGPASVHTPSSTSSTQKTTTMSPTTTTSEPLLSSSSDYSQLSSSLLSSSNFVSPSSSANSSRPTSSSPSATSSASPQPSSSPNGISFAVQNMTTCTSGLISWNYNGSDAELTLSIINLGVNDTSPQSTGDNSIGQELVVTTTSAQNWTWPSVNVTQGWYAIDGVVNSVQSNSQQFFVSNGTNVTCLTSTLATTSPQGATSSIDLASVVGGIVGGVVVLVLVIVGGVYWWRRKRRFVVGGGSRDRKWGSLKSTNSSIQPDNNEAQAAGRHLHGHSESTRAIFRDNAGGKASATGTPGTSDEDVATTTGEEKLVSPASSSGMSPFDVLNTPVRHDRRTSMYSVQTPVSPVSPVSPDGTTRSGSRCISNQSLEQQAQRIRSSMESSVRRRSERLSMPTVPPPSLSRIPQSPVNQAKEEYALSPVTPTPVNRSVSTGAVSMTTRRASRKPVPHYDPSLLEDTNADSVSTFTAGAGSSQSHGTGAMTGTHGTTSDSAHNSSLVDGRPVHYLIPDMPLQPRD